jgi:ubiquinone/menaquinone biosynthesis C-methylase UbiE
MPNERFFDWFFNSEIFVSSRRSESRKIWGYYDYLVDEPFRLATSERRYQRLRRFLPSDRPIEILKIGASTGSFLHVANQHGDRAIGCDVSSRFVEFAKRHYGVHIDHGRFEDVGYRSASFDTIVMLSVLENVPNPPRLLNEVHRVLRSGGHFVFNFIEMKHNIIEALQREKYFLFRPPVTYIYNGTLIERVLSLNGFRTEHNLTDMRYMHLGKILTLLGWNPIHNFTKRMRLASRAFPIYAYPSRIIIAVKPE